MKKYLVSTLIISLTIAGLLGIGVVLSGSFHEIQLKVLLTTLAFTVYSIIGLCCHTIIHSKYAAVAKTGLVVTMVALLHAVATTWVTPETLSFLQMRFSLFIVAISFAHCSLMLLLNSDSQVAMIAKSVAIGAGIFTALVAIAMIYSPYTDVAMLKLLIVILIVAVISTIIAPILALQTKRTT